MATPVKPGFLLLLMAALAPGAAGAFTAEGHRVVGIVAEAHLCPAARDYIAPLLEGATLASAGVWADAIRDDPAWTHTKPWHFINVGDDEPLAGVRRDPGGDVLAAIDRSERDLANRSLPRERRAEALRFFVHFVADVHQPLHVGRAGDHGGNDIEVRWGGSRMTLHEFWDGRAVLASEHLGSAELASAVDALATGEVGRWQASTPLAWAEESRALRAVVYDLPGPGAGLSRRYVATARNLISLRLAQAGVRLAGRLNRIACPGSPTLQ